MCSVMLRAHDLRSKQHMICIIYILIKPYSDSSCTMDGGTVILFPIFSLIFQFFPLICDMFEVFFAMYHYNNGWGQQIWLKVPFHLRSHTVPHLGWHFNEETYHRSPKYKKILGPKQYLKQTNWNPRSPKALSHKKQVNKGKYQCGNIFITYKRQMQLLNLWSLL